MDALSLAVGFLTGAITGAAGNYLADKFTDTRREKKQAREEQKKWNKIETKWPSVIQEMRADFAANPNVRAFFVKESNAMLGFTSEPSFEYHTDKHADLLAAIHCLTEQGFITDITPANCPMYRVHQKLIDRLHSKQR